VERRHTQRKSSKVSDGEGGLKGGIKDFVAKKEWRT